MDFIKEGELHYFKYGLSYRNPYPSTSDAHNQFERGWSQSLKKYPEVAERIENEKKDAESRQQRQKHLSKVNDAAAYRRAKGKDF